MVFAWGEPQERELVSVTSELVLDIGSKLEDVIKVIIENEPRRKFRIREVKEILEAQKYPTESENFIDVVGNTLRNLARDGKIGLEKTGKFVKFFSLASHGNNGDNRTEELSGRRKILY